MDASALTRIQTGLSLGAHFIFPSLTLGLALYVVVIEALRMASGNERYLEISKTAVRLLATVFAFGVATGITLPIAFGANWSRFTALAGPLFGANLAIEAIFAFSLEAAAAGVLIFGRERVGKLAYLIE